MQRQPSTGCVVCQSVEDYPTVPLSDLGLFDDLDGRFRLVRLIARGGMGEVYEAEDLAIRSRPRIALKVLRKEMAANPSMVARFEQELELSRHVTHPNVCRTYDFGIHQRRDEGGNPVSLAFLTMELLDGETLAWHLREKGRFSAAEALPVIGQLAAGLDAVHGAGIVHADLKPSNIVLVPAPAGTVRIVITDFGLAVPMWTNGNRQIARGVVVGGTPEFMAPEYRLRCPPKPSADIYSFGLVLYRMLTGVLPFDGAAPTPLCQYVPELDSRWEDAILRCLAIDPAHRFTAATDAVAAFGDAAESDYTFNFNFCAT